MLKTFTKLNNKKLTLGKNEIDKLNFNPGNKQPLNILKYIKSSRNFRQTNNNFRTNLSMSPFSEELLNQYKEDEIKKRTLMYFNFNKAPSIKDNYYKINKLIKLKRSERIKELDKIHNKILISESELYRNKLYITGFDYIPKDKNKNKIIKNLSCRELPLKKKKNNKKFNKIKLFKNPNNFYNTTSNVNSPNKIGTTILRNKTILSALTKEDTEKETDYALKTISKIQMNIIESLHNEFSPRKLVNTEKRLINFKIIQNIHNNKVKNMSVINNFIKEGYLRRLRHLEKIFQKIFEKYSKQMHLYLQFLSNTLDEERKELRVKNALIFNLSNQIEKLVIKLLNKQNELEFLVELRNFLLKIKNINDKNEKPQIYYVLLLIRDSKLLLIGNILDSINFIKQISSRTLLKFRSHIKNIIKIITNDKDKLELTEDIFNSLDLGNYQLSQIFSSPDAVINLYENLTEKDLNLLNILLDSKRENNNLERIYNKKLNFLVKENECEKNFNEIMEMEKLKEQLVKRNEILNKKYLYYNVSLDYKINPNKIASLKHNKNIPMYLEYNLNLDIIKREKYYNEMKKYKYKGLLLLEKLINMCKKFLKSKYSEGFIENLNNRNRLYILDLNIKSYNEENLNTINPNILKAISIYEDICKYVIFIHDKLKLNKNNLQFIQQQKNLIDYNRKVQNAKNEKQAKIIRNLEEREKIYEKAVKPVLYIETKNNVENKIKRKKIKNDRIKEREKHYEEYEFNRMIKFEDD